MGITIFFIIMSIVLAIGTGIYIKKNNKLYNFRAEEKTTTNKQKKNIKNIWGIEKIKDGVITAQGQNSIIVEMGGLEYNLLNDQEQDNIDNVLIRLSKTMSYKMQFFSTIVKVDTNDKIEEIRENIKRQRNTKMQEYGEEVIDYLDEIMQEENLYVRKNYIIFSSFEPQDKAKTNLTQFYNNFKTGLSQIGVSCNMLNDGGIIELIHRELNKNSTENIERIIKEGGLEIFVKSEEEKREENIIKE